MLRHVFGDTCERDAFAAFSPESVDVNILVVLLVELSFHEVRGMLRTDNTVLLGENWPGAPHKVDAAIPKSSTSY